MIDQQEIKSKNQVKSSFVCLNHNQVINITFSINNLEINYQRIISTF